MVLGGRESEVRVESMVLGGERRLLHARSIQTLVI